MMFGGSTTVFKVCYVFISLAWIWIKCTHCYQYHHTAKRALLFPETFVLQLTCCIAVPGTIPNRTLALNLCMQSNFNAPSNISQLTPTVVQARSSQSSDSFQDLDFSRNTLYTYIRNTLDEYGLHGGNCLLRSICEAAESPIHTAHRNSILENILYYILTPTIDQNLNTNSTEDNMIEYFEAEANGKLGKNCATVYSGCYFSILDYLTSKFLF